MKHVDGVKVISDHDPDCLAIKPWNHPDNPLWFSLGSIETVELDRIGRRLRKNSTGSTWVTFSCNSCCGAAILIRYDLLTKLAHAKMMEALYA